MRLDSNGAVLPTRPKSFPWMLAFCLLLLDGPVAAYDPALSWWTIKTPHFEIHFHQGAYHLAVQAARAAESLLEQVSEVLEHAPAGRIQLVISDEADTANGFAQVIPYNIIHALASAPEDLSVLNDYDNHLNLLLVHELTHIVHMDTISGLPAAINWVLGRTAFPNGAQPSWFIEGLAVHLESALSSAGRIRSSLFQMYLRTAALAGVIPELDQLSGMIKAWPQGNAPYLYGGFFVDYLARRFGEQALTDLSHRMGGMLLPWSLNLVARKELGADYPTLHRHWKESVLREASDTFRQVEREGLTPFRRLTRRGQHQRSPRMSPGGEQVLYYSSPTNRWPALRAVGKDGTADRQLVEVNSEGGASFTPDGRSIVFSQLDLVDQFYLFDDLFLLELETGKTQRLTRGLRARSPDVSPDGRWVVFVRNHLGRTQLAMAAIASGVEQGYREITKFDDGTQVYTPRFSPGGKQVVFSAALPGGGRNIMLLDLQTGSIQRLTQGRFMDLDPVFDRSGAGVIFSSDRNGIYNLYSLDLASRGIFQLTNLITGAFSPDPAPDSSGMVFMAYGKDGYDIAWLDLPLEKRPVKDSREARPPPPYQERPAAYPIAPYRPWSTLLPRSWFPFFGQDIWGATYGALLGGGDVLGKLDYRAAVSFGPANQQLYLDLGVATRVLYPTLSMYLGRHVYRYYYQAIVNGWPWPVDREKITLFFDIAFPFSGIRESHFIFANYDLQLQNRWTPVPRDPADLQPRLPDDSNLAWASCGWAYSSVRSYTHSISAEEGWYATISLRYSHPSLGSGSKITEARFALRTYLPVFRDWHHVLAFGLQGGIAVGDPRRKVVYSMGGLPIRDPIQDAYFGYRYGGLYLRGYPPAAFWGSVFVLGSAEYRLPVFDIESGVLTLPFYLRRLHAALFVDVGATGPDSLEADLLKVGVGTELRLDMLLAYYLPFMLRFGYGRGLSAGGTDNIYLVMGWGF